MRHKPPAGYDSRETPPWSPLTGGFLAGPGSGTAASTPLQRTPNLRPRLPGRTAAGQADKRQWNASPEKMSHSQEAHRS